MKLSNVRDEDLREVAKLKTRKGMYSSEAKRAQQILYTRNKTMGGFCKAKMCGAYRSTLDANPERKYRTFEEENGLSLAEYLAVKGNS